MKKCFVLLGLAAIVAVGAYLTRLHFKSNSAPPASSPSTTVSANKTGPADSPGTSGKLAASPAVTDTNQPDQSASRQSDSKINPYAGGLKEPGKSKRAWDPDFMKGFQKAASGDPIRFELTEGLMAVGSIKITTYHEGELTYFSGELTEPEAGTFFFLKPPEGGKAGKAVGVIEFAGSRTAYRIEPTGLNGEPELWKRRLDEVICLELPQPKAALADTNVVEEMTPLRPDGDWNYIPSYNTNVNGTAIISLQSCPGSPAVLLLDFFGGYTPTWGGVAYSVPSAANNVTIKDLWKRIAEDYQPFNINVTTDIKVYQAAPSASRQRCCFTDTPITAAGVAYIGSWNWGNDTPCWSVYTTGKNGGEVGAHEPGHTLGLGHETQEIPTGVGTNTTHNEYFAGQGTGATDWAPIMGAGYYDYVVTWSKGEFQYASYFQDELNNIVTANNNVAYRTDDTGSTLATSRYLEVYPDNSVFAEGLIERTDDTDAFQFTTTGGQVSLLASPVGDWANLALMATLADATDTIIASNNPQTVLSASITTNLPAGTYTFRVTGTGRNNPLTNGFSSYASLGYYSIAGSVAGARQPTMLSVLEHAANGTVVGPIPASDTNATLAYTILSGNTGGTFSVDTTGFVTVANNTLLDYYQLSTNYLPGVQFELFVNITNLDNPSLTELNRRVVISVLQTNVNNPIVVTGFNAGVIVPYNGTIATPKATAFDIPNGWCFYQAGLSNGTRGLPVNGRFSSAVDNTTFQFGRYGATNALLMGYTYPASGKLTLVNPQPYNSIAILASSANGGGAGTLSFTFTNGTRSQTFNFNAQDWYGVTANVALQGFGRVRLSNLSFEDPGYNNPNFYQTTVNLAALGLNQPIASINFTNPAVGGSQDSGIFAISGMVMPSEVAISRQPVSVTNTVPGAATLLSVVAMGAPSLGYQWYGGTPGSGTLLVGKTAANLIFSSVQTTDAGNYYVVVTNSFSAATSSVASLTVFRAPQITQQPSPTNLVLFAGRNNTFSVAANAATPVYYFWRLNETNISGATSASYTRSNLQPANSGNYSVVVSNAFGSVTSSVVSLTVVTATYPFAQLALADQPAGYWPLNETSGTVAYDYAAGNNGSYTNTLLGQTGYSTLDSHKAARFGLLASTNSYVGGIPINLATSTNRNFTIEAWVNGGAQTTDAGLVAKGTGSGGEQFNLDCGGGSHGFRFFVRDMTGAAHLASSSVTPGSKWNHVVGVCDMAHSNIILYVNGTNAAQGSIVPGSGILSSTNMVSIGSRQSGTTSYNNQFIGYMEEVAIYNYALSAAQVQSHFAAATNRPPAFTSDPFSKGNANAGQYYSGTIAANASDPNGDSITFSKLSGPAWLSVAANGFIFGTPASSDSGTNSFIVKVTDAGGLTNTATMYVYVNGAPSFTGNPFTAPDVTAGQACSGTIAANATDPNPGDTLTFAKISGPAWLGVATNGNLSGTPLSTNVGINAFIVSVTDSGSLSNTATMNITVISAPPTVAGISFQDGNFGLTWSGGVGPYQVQMTTNLAGANWQTIASDINTTNLLLIPSNNAAFYRIVGQ